jgi:hypothetical protein
MRQLFEFGDRYRGTYDSSIAEARSYYASVTGYRDELLWAMTEFSWDVKYAGVQVLTARAGNGCLEIRIIRIRIR